MSVSFANERNYVFFIAKENVWEIYTSLIIFWKKEDICKA